MLSSDNTFDNVIDYDDDDQAAAPSAEAEKAAKAEELPDHLHQAARHAILLRARAGTWIKNEMKLTYLSFRLP